jgi:hypothetical protein
MLTRLLLTMLLFCSVPAFAQTMSTGWRNHEYETKQFSDIDGSPFLYDDWYKGRIVSVDGAVLENALIKYEAYSEYLVYMLDNKTYDISSGLRSFTLYPGVDGMKDSLLFRCGYPPVDNNTGKTCYEVLADGRAALLKSHRKTTGVSSQNALVSNKREFILTEDLYIAVDRQAPVKAKKDRNALLDLMGDRKDEMSAWLDKNKVNLKRDEGIAAMVAHYNSL